MKKFLFLIAVTLMLCSTLNADELQNIIQKISSVEETQSDTPEYYNCLINEKIHQLDKKNRLQFTISTLMEYIYKKPNYREYILVSTNSPDAASLKKNITEKDDENSIKKNPFLKEQQNNYDFSIEEKISEGDSVLYKIRTEPKSNLTDYSNVLTGFFVADSSSGLILEYEYSPYELEFPLKRFKISGKNKVYEDDGKVYSLFDEIKAEMEIKVFFIYYKNIITKRKFYNYSFEKSE